MPKPISDAPPSTRTAPFMRLASLFFVLASGFLDQAGQALAPAELAPYRLRLDPVGRPQSEQVVEHVGAFANELGPVAANALDDRLDRFLAQFLGDLLAAAR